jgi:TolB-like protein/Tfp pilus assembly protein PilF
MRSFLAELRRRNVLRAGALYVAAIWALAQGIAQLSPAFGAPEWLTRWFVIAGVVGFPFWIAFTWLYEFTPEGLRRESEIDPAESITAHTGKKLDRWIIATLALAVVLLLTDRFVLHKDANALATPPVPDKSIAVLPFVDMSAEKDQEYMSDGLAEELLNLLAQVPALHVTSRTSAFAFKGKSAAISDIARQLNVAHVLEGSVRKSGNRLRITAQLIDARTDTHLWSETYDRTLDDIFSVQDEIAATVVAHLKIELLGATPKAKETDPKAYALYLKARKLLRNGSAKDLEESIAANRQAVAIDPEYAAAWVGLAGTYLSQANKGLKPIDESYRLAREAIQKALATDPDFAPAFRSLSRIASDYDGDFYAAARHMERALALEPTDPDTIGAASGLAQALGRLDQALALDEYAVARDPLNPARHGSLGYDFARMGRLDEAIARYRTALRLSPGRVGTQYNIGEALLRKGDAAAALSAMQEEGDENWRLMGVTMALYSLGKKAESDAALAELIARYEKDSAYNIAYVLAYRHENDRAFEWLERAVAYHDTGLVEISDDPMFANIRDDPRWLPFLRKIGKAPEQLAKIEFKVALPRDAVAPSVDAQTGR